MIEIDNEIFHKNLLLTQAYCDLQLKNGHNDPITSLRTFNPVYNGRELFSYDKVGSLQWKINPLGGYNLLYDELFEKQLDHKRKALSTVDVSIKFEGRILVAEIDMTVIDGASEVQSEGFIDINDCPPIDTWFYKKSEKSYRIFFAWVPQQFVELADKAIAVNCVDCLLWYNDWILKEKEAEKLKEKESKKIKKAGSKTSFIKYINKFFK